jgi:Concanavalin A-like lectin/glucanases superfamily
MRCSSLTWSIQLFLLTTLTVCGVETAVQRTAIWRMEQRTLRKIPSIQVLGQPRAVSDPEGEAIYFNGATDGFIFPSNPLEGTSAFTIEVCFKPDADGPAEQRFLHVEDNQSNRALLEIRQKDKNWALDTFLYSAKNESKCTLLDRTKTHPSDRWTWVALTYENGHMAHFINGVKELAGEVDFPLFGAGQISAGVRLNKVYWFKGSIREIRFHQVALPDEKLQRADTK